MLKESPSTKRHEGTRREESVGSSAKRFDFAQYHDTYTSKLRELIEAKAAGKKIVAPRGQEEPHVINLMDALRRSLEDVQKGHGREKANGAKRAPRARHHAGRRRTG